MEIRRVCESLSLCGKALKHTQKLKDSKSQRAVLEKGKCSYTHELIGVLAMSRDCGSDGRSVRLA
jgi:hypothetical protein